MSKKTRNQVALPSAQDVDKFERLSPLLNSIYHEIKEFSKKKPDDVLNALKVKMINRVLTQVKDFLKNDPNIEFLELIDDTALPSYSDTVLIIGQFRAVLDQFKERFYWQDESFNTRWHTTEYP